MSCDKKIPPLDIQRARIMEFNRVFLSGTAIAKSRQIQDMQFCVQNADRNLLRNAHEVTVDRNILFVLPYTVAGGADKRFLEIGTLLKENGCKLTVMTTLDIDPKQHDTSDKFETLTPDVFHLPRFLPDQSAWRDFFSYIIRSRKIDRVLLGGSQFFYDILPSLKVEFPNLKVIDQLFNTDLHFDNNRRASKWIDFTIAENEVVFSELKVRGETDDRIALVHNGVEVHGAFSPSAERPSRPSELPADKIIISFIGRISDEKGPDLFIDIAESLAENSQLHFVLAGPGTLAAQMQEIIKGYGLESRISTPGHIDARQYLCATDILVVPSRTDGRPNVILEGLSLGLPIVASAVGGIPAMIQDGETGFLCDPEDINSFAQRIELLAANSELRAKIGKQAREFAVKHLDNALTLERYLDFFGLAAEVTVPACTSA